MSIGQNIKALRESHDMTQAQLGRVAGVTDKAVSTWEADIKVPRMGAIQKIADYFHVPKSAIIDDVKMDSPAPSPAPLPPLIGKLVSIASSLNGEGQEKLVEYAQLLDSSGQYKKYDSSELGRKEA